jgi:predicted type IV restriction endonuclease
MTAPAVVRELVERFESQRDSYRSSQYHETQLRREFLDPFFEALGWDVFNRKGYAEAYKEVIHEDAIRVGGRTKAPDYCFRAGGGMRSFFVEAKKPSVGIHEDAAAAFQIRRYAWSAKLPVSILADFAELAVYDCRIRPEKTDKAAVARILCYRASEYLERWDELWDLFSPEAIRRGSLEKLVGSKKTKKGTAEVDAAFLSEIEGWRDVLARNLAARNRGISDRDLNFAVQRTIDRIVFLRICEDRGIETYGRLQGLANAPNIYRRLAELFQRADERYNSGLFYFDAERGRHDPPDDVTLGLAVDDKPLRDILQSLYFPDSPYEFSVLPAEILGQVYEQFLGKVIRLTKGGQARVEEKPEVRKAGGVYYTPAYIVDYIVQNTLGKLLEGRRPRWASGVRVLDPACGSGSFLIGAYQFLLDWHRDWYAQRGPERHARGRNPVLYRGAGGQWRLTATEKKRILLNNIFGVDIDSQAVEVTKLSLLLKVLEGESEETVSNQLRLYHERALPDLGANIKCGNSLIGPDFYNGRQRNLFDEEERYRINDFDWKAEFPGVFGAGGFDAVIGNPPYLFITEIPQDMRAYYQDTYHGVSYRFDLYGAFLERAATLLLRREGVLGFIVPHTLLSNDSFRELRALLSQRVRLIGVTDFGPGVFRRAKNETMVLFFEVGPPSASTRVTVARTTASAFPALLERFRASQPRWARADGAAWLVRASRGAARVVRRMASLRTTLRDMCTANQGLRTGDNARFLSAVSGGKSWKPAAGGKQVGRYAPIQRGLFVQYEPSLLDAPRRPEIFTSPEKIVVQEVRNISLQRRIVATLDTSQAFCLQSTNVVNSRPECTLDIRYILGVLNSCAVNFYFRCTFPGNNHIPSNQLLSIPIPSPPARQAHDRLVDLVQTILDLHRHLAVAKRPSDKTVLKRQIEATDRQIDRVVYELYGLTDKENAIVEEATRPSN